MISECSLGIVSDLTSIEMITAPQTTSEAKNRDVLGISSYNSIPNDSSNNTGAVTTSAIEIAPLGLHNDKILRSSGCTFEPLKNKLTVTGLMSMMPIQA